MKELRLEHFKALKEEHRQYLFQVQQLWIFKLSTLGVVIATAIFNDKIIGLKGLDTDTIVAAGLFSLPLLAFLIDLKALEVGLHVKSISDHIKNNYCDIPEIKKWESGLWSKNKLSRLRTWLTIFAAIGTSIAVLAISFIIIYRIKPNWVVSLWLTGLISITIVVLVSLKVLPKIIR